MPVAKGWLDDAQPCKQTTGDRLDENANSADMFKLTGDDDADKTRVFDLYQMTTHVCTTYPMCSGGFAKCLGITLLPLSVACVLCNILLFFPGGNVTDSERISEEVLYFGGILGSGVLMIFPALVFLGLKNNDCCGCCGNESCGKRFAMLSSILFAVVGVLGAGYSVAVSAVAINKGPFCLDVYTKNWTYPFENTDYLSKSETWSTCVEPKDVVSWNLSLFSVLLAMGLIQMMLCGVQVVNGLLGAICGDCCGCCGGSDPAA